MGLKLVSDDKGPVKVFRKDKEYAGGTFATYSVGVSSKDKDGNWVNGYLDVQFKKGVELGNKAEIKVINSFPTVREYNGKKYVSWFILDFEEVSQGEAPSSADMGFANIPFDEQLPFAQPSR